MSKLDAILDLPGQAFIFFLNKWKIVLALAILVIVVGWLNHCRALNELKQHSTAPSGVTVKNKEAVYEKQKRAIDNINAMPDTALQREVIRVFGN